MTVYDERVRLLATALNNAAVSAFTVGIAAPLAAVFYNFGGTRVAALWMAMEGAIWLLAAVALHLAARHVLGGLDDDAK
jgi:Na+/pantothenate symporter